MTSPNLNRDIQEALARMERERLYPTHPVERVLAGAIWLAKWIAIYVAFWSVVFTLASLAR